MKLIKKVERHPGISHSKKVGNVECGLDFPSVRSPTDNLLNS